MASDTYALELRGVRDEEPADDSWVIVGRFCETPVWVARASRVLVLASRQNDLWLLSTDRKKFATARRARPHTRRVRYPDYLGTKPNLEGGALRRHDPNGLARRGG